MFTTEPSGNPATVPFGKVTDPTTKLPDCSTIGNVSEIGEELGEGGFGGPTDPCSEGASWEGRRFEVSEGAPSSGLGEILDEIELATDSVGDPELDGR
jgi:hypothetical protein